MSLFFGSGAKKVKPQYTGLATQTSTSNVPVPIVWGKTRVAPNIILQTDFQAHKQKQKAGKGGGGSTTSYTYSGTYQLALCWGPATAVVRTWKDQSKETDYTKLGFSLQTGTIPQAPWGYMVSAHPTQALGYSGIVLMNVANYDLGSTNTLGQHSFEIENFLYNTQVGGAGDADCAEVMQDFLTNEIYGVPVNASIISNMMSTGSSDGSYQNYCRAIGFGFSPALTSQEAANAIIDRWCKLTNTAPVWTGYTLKLVPYADETVTGNGVTYVPSFPIRYTVTDKDFQSVSDGDPITFDRVDPADAYNSLTITIKNRANEYNDLPVEWRDQGLVDQYGLRAGDGMNAFEVCDKDMAARMVALIGQRVGYIRNVYNFTLPPRFCLLEPMDVLQCVDPKLGTFTVLIREISEGEDDNLAIIAEEYASSVTQSGVTQGATTSNNPINTGVTASNVNTPILIQPPPSLTGGQPQMWAAVSGGNPLDTTDDPYWGGCQVWVSTDGGTSYNMVGTIDSPARMGKLTAALAAYGGANPDNTNTMKVNFAMSGAVFDDVATASDAAAGVTIGFIQKEGANSDEFLSYRTPTLNSPDNYWFTNLYRGQNGSTAGAHAIGARYARLDTESIFKYTFPKALIGQTIHVKFVSFNIWGGGLQDIASVTDYTFTISAAYTYGTGISDLNDVNLGSGPTNGQVLIWDATTHKWVPGTPGGVTSYASLTDVDMTGLTDGQGVRWDATAGKWKPVDINLYRFGAFAIAAASANEVLLEHVLTDNVTFPANFALSKASIGVNPTATDTLIVNKISGGTTTQIGTIAFSTSGVATLATTGGTAQTASAGDVIQVKAPNSPDTTAASIRFTFRCVPYYGGYIETLVIGNTSSGTTFNYGGNFKSVISMTVPTGGVWVKKIKTKISNSTSGDKITPVIYSGVVSSSTLVKAGQELVLPTISSGTDVETTWNADGSAYFLAAGTYGIGFITSGNPTATALAGGTTTWNADTYSDGPASPFGTTSSSSNTATIWMNASVTGP